jgi:hypothetical protein
VLFWGFRDCSGFSVKVINWFFLLVFAFFRVNSRGGMAEKSRNGRKYAISNLARNIGCIPI